MCDQDAGQSFSIPFAKQDRGPEPSPASGSRRRRLWDLPRDSHCPVVGVCLPLGTLRRLVNKAWGGQALTDDYEIHVGAVAECERRNRLSELLQHELEQRYSRIVQHFKLAKTTGAVAQLWAQAVQQGDVAGAFWAALTHPRCSSVLQEALCRDIHMLGHQAGASVRADLSRFTALLEENAVLARELSKVQQRSTRLMADKSSEVERLNAQLMQVRAEQIAKDSRIAFLMEDLTALKAAIPGLESRTRLQKKIGQMRERHSELETNISHLRQQLAATTKAPESAGPAASQEVRMDTGWQHAPRSFPIALHLQQKTVLCVGGRSGNVASYRDLIERVGGRFAHHDGGVEDNQSMLDANLAAADLVICQTGCISHNAYWRVKDFCKRSGKRCVFVENPSATSLARRLEQISAKDDDGVLTERTEHSIKA